MDAVLNLGLPAPIDVQVAGTNMKNAYATAHRAWPRRSARFDGVADVFIPQDIDYPALQPRCGPHARQRSSAWISARWSAT